MTAHNFQNYGIATTADMMFDELFQEKAPTMKVDSNAKQTSRLVSAPYDEHHADMNQAVAAPVTPSSSGESSAIDSNCITGKLSDIEYKYHIDPHVIGTGHHGSVRECINRATGQRFAVKSIRKSDKSVKASGLAREIMLLQEMKHHNIVKLVDCFEDHEYLHIVTDLCKGGELYERIVKKSSNSENSGVPCFMEAEAARILYQILTAISYMHSHGIVHRDIKPENILFVSNEEDSPIKIIDFGLSRKHHAGEAPMTNLLGTPFYIAPEVLKRKYDKSCDLWSVGVIAYILLCGYPPFNGENNHEVHASILRGRYRFHSEEWSGVSREAKDFVRRLLKRDPRKRMSIEMAFNHPWMLRHMNINHVVDMANVEDRRDDFVYAEMRAAAQREANTIWYREADRICENT